MTAVSRPLGSMTLGYGDSTLTGDAYLRMDARSTLCARAGSARQSRAAQENTAGFSGQATFNTAVADLHEQPLFVHLER